MQKSLTKHSRKSPPVYALTGSMGSGKSAVSSVFSAAGIPVIDADVSAREVVAPGSPGLSEILRVFGREFLSADGGLDRKKLGAYVFTHAEERKKLEEILHPLIRKRFEEEYSRVSKEQPAPDFIIYVIPLYFETGAAYPGMEKVIVVSAPRDVCVQRIMSRDHCSRELAEKKLNAQTPDEIKVARADFVIENSGTLSELERKTRQLISKLRSLK